MSRVFITGSADGLGMLAGRFLASQGHSVVLHARNPARAADAHAALPTAEAVLTGDLATLAAMKDVAQQANSSGRFDAVIHNVGLGYQEPRTVTQDGLTRLWAVNVLAPYVLTARMEHPSRLVYLTSGMHQGGDPSLADPQWESRRWNGSQAYSDTKLHDLLLTFGVARRWPGVSVNAVSPGWVPTRMGGRGAPDDLQEGYRTQAWLATSSEPDALESGRYLYHQRPADLLPAARDEHLQDQLLAYCEQLSGVALPHS